MPRSCPRRDRLGLWVWASVRASLASPFVQPAWILSGVAPLSLGQGPRVFLLSSLPSSRGRRRGWVSGHTFEPQGAKRPAS